MWLVSSLVSIPYIAVVLFSINQLFKSPSERQFDGEVIELLKIAPLIFKL